MNMKSLAILEASAILKHLKAAEEYEKYKEKTKDELSRVEKDFLLSLDNASSLIELKNR